MPCKDPIERASKHKTYMASKYANDPEFKASHIKRVAASKKQYKIQAQKLIDAFRSSGCKICQENEACCLSAHHLRDKEFQIARAIGRGIAIDRIKMELLKCICLCENCHRKVHAGIIDLRKCL